MEDLKTIVDEINLKFIVLGEGRVGKTSLINTFIENNFPEKYLPTIGSNIVKKNYEFENRNLRLKINIWDNGGQKSFNLFNPNVYYNADAALIIFDLSEPKKTLENIKTQYLQNLEKYAQNCITIIVGNKLDLLINIEKDLKKIVKKYFTEEIPLIITSAKSSENVNKAFELLVYNVLKEGLQKFTDKNIDGIAKDFIKLVGISEDKLSNLFVNLSSLDTVDFQNKSEKITVKSETQYEGIDSYIEVHEKLEEIAEIKEKIVEKFDDNFEIIDNLVINLKKTPIDSLLESIDSTREQLNVIKKNFKSFLDQLIREKEKNA